MPALAEVVSLRRVEELFGSRNKEDRGLSEVQIKALAPGLITDIAFIVTSLAECPEQYRDFTSIPRATFDFDIERIAKNLQITSSADGGLVFSYILGNDRSKKEGTIDAKHGVIRCSGFSVDCNGKIHQDPPVEDSLQAIQEIEGVFESLIINQ